LVRGTFVPNAKQPAFVVAPPHLCEAPAFDAALASARRCPHTMGSAKLDRERDSGPEQKSRDSAEPRPRGPALAPHERAERSADEKPRPAEDYQQIEPTDVEGNVVFRQQRRAWA